MKRLHTNFVWALTGEPQEMLVENGRVVARGTAVEGYYDDKVDHGGRRLAPSFIDSHCHILPTGLDLLKLHLGAATSPENVLDLLSKRNREAQEGWLLAVHYDHNRFESGRHLTKTELDRISLERPVFIRHVSGHSGVANSAALELADISAATPDPIGGTFVRGEDGAPNGVLLETAMNPVEKAMPMPTLEEMVSAILAAGVSMREWQIVNASDMQTGSFDLMTELEAYRLAAERGCKIDTRLYMNWSRVFGPKKAMGVEAGLAMLDGERCRVGGIKLFADGAVGSGTAAIYGAYAGQETHGQYAGTLIYPPEVLKARVVEAADAGYQVSVHAIGDYAIDLVMDAFEATDNPSHHRLE
ncbi:MAG TPA: amidohydrolase family protein, partial [Fimbriimonas sp.]|nr:amidohydrolase family protein [Fimbriimonas sp.]